MHSPTCGARSTRMSSAVVCAGSTNNPRRGVLLSAAIAGVAIALGNLNLIAPIVAMFFLISYGLLNYATFVEARSNSPSFRPRFRFFDARLSFLGGLAWSWTRKCTPFLPASMSSPRVVTPFFRSRSS